MLVISILIFTPLVYFNYILKFTYDFGWCTVILLGFVGFISLTHFVLKPIFTSIKPVIVADKLRKKFMWYCNPGNENLRDVNEMKEEIIRKMLKRGVNSFSKMNFTDLNLAGMDFRGVKFTYCSFYNCNLSRARMQRVLFDGCIFDKADFTNANLKNATISGVSLHFDNAIMTNTNLDNTQVIRTMPYNEKLDEFCLTELENNKVTGIKELKEKYMCRSKNEYKRSVSSIDSFLIIPRIYN